MIERLLLGEGAVDCAGCGWVMLDLGLSKDTRENCILESDNFRLHTKACIHVCQVT